MKSVPKPETVKDSDHRAIFVGQEAKESAGGTVTRDLFSETVHLIDLDDDDEDRPAALQAILDGTYTGDKKAISGCFISVNQIGKVEITARLVRVDDKSAAIKAGVLAAPECSDPAPKSPFSQKLTADLQAIRLAAVQSVLLAKPDIVLDLLAFGHSEASGHVESVFHLRIARPVNVSSIEDGFAHEPRLDHGLEPTTFWQDGTCMADLEKAFASFRADG